jgi:hypothetical protein
MTAKTAELIHGDFKEVCRLLSGSCIVALRWDLLDWALVACVRLDVELGLEVGATTAWAIFDGLSGCRFPTQFLRTPTGLYCNGIAATRHDESLLDYRLSLAVIPENGQDHPTAVELAIRAQRISILPAVGVDDDDRGFRTLVNSAR